jgi:hypothetical protein
LQCYSTLHALLVLKRRSFETEQQSCHRLCSTVNQATSSLLLSLRVVILHRSAPLLLAPAARSPFRVKLHWNATCAAGTLLPGIRLLLLPSIYVQPLLFLH